MPSTNSEIKLCFLLTFWTPCIHVVRLCVFKDTVRTTMKQQIIKILSSYSLVET